eukprot:TRINITY_DN6061_c0_g1_i1.p1 TRINITY_DN6061_c0_g1~~TRINITY_DN6061_c0_g1_i1.p1  ORF type:complete len:629 (+),score=61.07 TRINITY_DN6061_c0_g1_i1:130-2016(+)
MAVSQVGSSPFQSPCHGVVWDGQQHCWIALPVEASGAPERFVPQQLGFEGAREQAVRRRKELEAVGSATPHAGLDNDSIQVVIQQSGQVASPPEQGSGFSESLGSLDITEQGIADPACQSVGQQSVGQQSVGQVESDLSNANSPLSIVMSNVEAGTCFNSGMESSGPKTCSSRHSLAGASTSADSAVNPSTSQATMSSSGVPISVTSHRGVSAAAAAGVQLVAGGGSGGADGLKNSTTVSIASKHAIIPVSNRVPSPPGTRSSAQRGRMGSRENSMSPGPTAWRPNGLRQAPPGASPQRQQSARRLEKSGSSRNQPERTSTLRSDPDRLHRLAQPRSSQAQGYCGNSPQDRRYMPDRRQEHDRVVMASIHELQAQMRQLQEERNAFAEERNAFAEDNQKLRSRVGELEAQLKGTNKASAPSPALAAPAQARPAGAAVTNDRRSNPDSAAGVARSISCETLAKAPPSVPASAVASRPEATKAQVQPATRTSLGNPAGHVPAGHVPAVSGRISQPPSTRSSLQSMTSGKAPVRLSSPATSAQGYEKVVHHGGSASAAAPPSSPPVGSYTQLSSSAAAPAGSNSGAVHPLGHVSPARQDTRSLAASIGFQPNRMGYISQSVSATVLPWTAS